MQHAPIWNQHERWRIVGKRLAAQRAASGDVLSAERGLEHGKVLLLLGTENLELGFKEDIEQVLGQDGVQVEILEGGHDLVYADSAAVAKATLRFWGL